MKLQLTPKYVVAFLALLFSMHEAHEIVHTTVGRFLCGCWGARDFNVWGLCNECAVEEPITLLATFAGPIFTFIMIWLGTFFLASDRSLKEKTIGFSLIFANMPFARILTAAMGGGDEVWALNELVGSYQIAHGVGLSSIVLLTAYPLYRAFFSINNKWRLVWFLSFFVLPVFIDFFLVLGVMNSLLEKGIGANYGVLGSPVLVTIWTVTVLIMLLLSRHNFSLLGATSKKGNTDNIGEI